MKKLITLFCLFTVLCNAQTNVTYKTLNYDLQMRSLNGDSVSLFKKLAEGKTVIIDISATWCPPCWDFHKTRVLDSLHNRSVVMFIEADWSTPDSALYGKGSRTRGNWTGETVIIAAESLEDILRKEEWLNCDPKDKYSMTVVNIGKIQDLKMVML